METAEKTYINEAQNQELLASIIMDMQEQQRELEREILPVLSMASEMSGSDLFQEMVDKLDIKVSQLASATEGLECLLTKDEDEDLD